MISELSDDPIIAELRARLNARINGLRLEIANNTCKDFAHYKLLCGMVRGLHIAQDIVSESIKHYTDDEDDLTLD